MPDTDDRPWAPCPLCRSGSIGVQRPHWRGFETAAKLEAHLKDNLPKAEQESGGLRAILADWKLNDRFRTMKREACGDPMKSVEKMFEAQFGKRART
jgi:hypothetical protein